MVTIGKLWFIFISNVDMHLFFTLAEMNLKKRL